MRLVGLIGLLMIAVDVFGLTAAAEAFLQRMRDRMTTATGRWWTAVNGPIEEPMLATLGRWLLVIGLIAVIMLGSLYIGFLVLEPLGFESAALLLPPATFILIVIVLFGPYVLGLMAGILHVLSLPPKGIIGSIGLVIAVLGYLYGD